MANPPSDSDVLIRAENVGKTFCTDLKRSLLYGARDSLGDIFPAAQRRLDSGGRPILRPSEFWANQNISFQVRRGEAYGLIGHNGAGKTTLLKMLNGLIKPDTGYIEMRGRVGALIALGAGFNPVLTGRENVYIAGAVIGISKKEMDRRYDEIVDFAETHDFMETPLRNYSSGMRVRLGFAIASSIDPDVLLLDEVLAVGDMTFVVKCLNRVRDMMSRCAVILVSHRMQQISNFCTHVLMLEHGQISYHSNDVPRGIDLYLSRIASHSSTAGTGQVSFSNASIIGENKHDDTFRPDEKLALHLEFEVVDDIEVSIFATICSQDQNPVMVLDLSDSDKRLRNFRRGKYRVAVDLGALELSPGRYTFILNAKIGGVSGDQIARAEGVAPFLISGDVMRYSPFARSVYCTVTTA
ncbi:MAG: polysaccharide ABC transporter ATP-binding protein [Verrucomicrobiota bacterium JB022]|nr:polysaccharide ABC transporter ATP-binding protein [Verrucomicrobiota bacterium JB022]